MAPDGFLIKKYMSQSQGHINLLRNSLDLGYEIRCGKNISLIAGTGVFITGLRYLDSASIRTTVGHLYGFNLGVSVQKYFKAKDKDLKDLMPYLNFNACMSSFNLNHSFAQFGDHTFMLTLTLGLRFHPNGAFFKASSTGALKGARHQVR